MRKVLVTAGSTASPIDQVREIRNIFRGRTGARIVETFISEGVDCTLVTSAQSVPERLHGQGELRVLNFRTFEDLLRIMEEEIKSFSYDAIIHSAAVNDYRVARVLDKYLKPVDALTKILSTYPKLYLELEPNIKIVDQIREPWGFRGKLVKFKLQVGISDDELIEIARKSMAKSRANFIVANCLEWCQERAYIIDEDGSVANIPRNDLPGELLGRLV